MYTTHPSNPSVLCLVGLGLLSAASGCTPPTASIDDKAPGDSTPGDTETDTDSAGTDTDSVDSDSGDTDDTAASDIVLAENLRVLEAADEASLIRVDDGGATLVFSSLPAPISALVAGDLLAAAPSSLLPHGLLVHVESVAEIGDETRVAVRAAPLSAAIVKGTLTFNAPVSSATLVSSTALVDGVTFGSAFAPPPAEITADLVTNLEPRVLYDYDGDEGTTDDQVVVATTLTFGTSLDLAMSFDGGSLETFALTGEASMAVQSILTATMPGLSMEESIDIATLEFAPVTILVPFGPIVWPVTVVPVATAYVGGSVAVEASMTVEGTASLTATAGVFYADESWTTTADVTPSANVAITPHLAGDAKVWVGVRTELLVYGVTGPQLNSWNYLHGQASTDSEPCWEVSTGDALDASVYFAGMDDDWAEALRWHLYDEETPFAVSDETPELWFLDGDEDGYGDESISVLTCWGGDGFSMTPGDCDDGSDAVNPDAVEVCDGVDNNCDDAMDGADATGLFDWYGDHDGDGYGVSTDYVAACTAPTGYVDGTGGLDCNDAAVDVNPGQVEAGEVCSDGVDQDCDAAVDCADADCVATPGIEECESALDEDCDGAVDCDDAECESDAVCPGCGNGVIDSGEDCDGAELGGLSCVDIGFDSGTLACSACVFDEVGCSSVEVCDDGVDNDGDGGVDCDDGDCGGEVGCVAVERSLSTADAVFTGEVAGDNAGFSLSGRGDFNGDGYDDMLVGANGNSDGSPYAGAAYVVLGSGSVGSASMSTAIQLAGYYDRNKAGNSVNFAQDFDGDGLDDVIVGASEDTTAGAESGAAYLVLGSLSPTSELLSAADAQFTGEGERHYAGWSVASAGDINGDGFGDLLVGARDEIGGAAGAAYAVFGSSAPASASLVAADAKLTGEGGGEYAGWANAGTGDVNGDGLDDFLVGSLGGGGGHGRTYLVLGSGSPTWGPLSAADAQLTGVAGDSAGQAVAGPGDVDGDGLQDVLIGAPANDDGGYQSGAAYVVLGTTTPASITLSDADLQLTGVAGDVAGWSVSGAGDVDGDGTGDLVVGAYVGLGGFADPGAAYLVLGPFISGSSDLPTAAYRLTGEAVGDLAGYSVSGAGDVDLDGFADVLVGALGSDVAGTNAGAAYLILGSSL